ncbi:MAG: right-handed parallel beta-helix repeat-containing protein [Bacteroidota bacterium]|nr:right-handed parallel beta-helix repeat-containing protein [Bacteroidota bacterium]
MMNPLKLNILMLVLSFWFSLAHSQNYYVSPSGNDHNPGTLQKPFATITKARDTVRKLKKNKSIPNGGITIFIRGGNYQFTSSFELTAEDAGEKNKPIRYQSYKNEKPSFIGGLLVDSKKWVPINSVARKRLHPGIDASKIYELDVSVMGLKNVARFAPANQFTTDWYIIDLYADQKRQPVSQWPDPGENIRGKNDPGWTTCNGSKNNCSFYYGWGGHPEDRDTTDEVDADGTNRARRWQNSINEGHELWLKGLWRTPWAPITTKVKAIHLEDQSIEFCEQPPQGMGSKYSPVANNNPLWRVGSGKENWLAINFLDEINQPGEWALDFKDGKLYYYPPKPIGQLNMMIADMVMPVIRMQSTKYVQLNGISIEGGLGNGIEMDDCSNILIADCSIRNVGSTGICMNGGENNIIQSNDIYETGGWGMELKNLGNRFTLASSNVTIINNYIHHVGNLAFKEAVALENCVGVLISHNLLHDIPKGAIRTDNVNNCVFEYNEIHNIALKEGDTGVFYNYGGWSTYGNIFKYNFSHHTNRANGFYSDDGTSGDVYFKNIVQGAISAVKFGGGHDNLAENNLFIESHDQTVDDRGINRNYRLGTNYETNLTKFNINAEPWKSYGVKLKSSFNLTTNLWSDVLNPSWHPEYPNGCRMNNNVAVACGPFVKKLGNVEISGNNTIQKLADAAFYDYPKMDLRTDNKLILEKFPDLNEVFPKIGLQKDQYRKTIPSREETGGLENRTKTDALDTEDKMIDQVSSVTNHRKSK